MRRERKFFFVFLWALLPFSTLYSQVTIGSDNQPPRAAILNLQTQTDSDPVNGGVTSTKGGLLITRVKLEATHSLAPFIVGGGTNNQKRAHKGMNVYHIGGNGIDTGQYVWDGTQWLLLLTGIPPTPINTSIIMDLQTHVMVPLAHWQQPDAGAVLDFGNLPINESGAYALSLRLYGRVYEDENETITLTQERSTSVYIWLFRSGSPTHIDAAEITMVSLPTSAPGGGNSPVSAFTTSLTVPWVEAGETLSIRIATNQAYSKYRWKLMSGTQPAAARTSLFYWKL